MENLKKFSNVLFNVQILSALIWAATILGVTAVTKDPTVFKVIMVCAGFHVVLLSRKSVERKSCEVST